MISTEPVTRPVLAGLRVVEIGSYVAAPTAGRLLAAFGAEVIKVERPGGGDEVRRWHSYGGETSLLWRSLGRNKKSVTIDLQDPDGVELLLGLVGCSDVVLEGFRPGTLERLGLGPKILSAVRPDVILVRVSGFGQNGPYRHRAGFGSVGEAMGGLRYLTGYPDRPPTRAGLSLGDSVAGLYASIGTLLALLERYQQSPTSKVKPGNEPAETVDVALYEAVYSLLDSVVAEYDAFGLIRQRTGTEIAGVAPSNTYGCSDDKYVVIGANGDAVFTRLAHAMGMPELTADARYADATARAKASHDLDEKIGRWVSQRSLADVTAVMEAAGVPATPIYDAADIAGDTHYKARRVHERHDLVFGDGTTRPVTFPAPVPRLSRSPAQQGWIGPDLGAHTVEVLSDLLGLSAERLDALAARGVI